MRKISLLAGAVVATLALAACQNRSDDNNGAMTGTGPATTDPAASQPATSDPSTTASTGTGNSPGADTGNSGDTGMGTGTGTGAGTGTGTGTDAGAAGTAPAGTAGVARAPEPGVAPHVRARYDCDGKPLSVDFDNTANTVQLQVGTQTLSLPSTTSGSGARYADDKGNQFWEHQGQAMLTLAGGKQQTCKKADTPAG